MSKFKFEVIESKWEKYPTDELLDIFSDYHIDVYDYRPRSNFLTHSEIVAGLDRIDNYMDTMKSTEPGREQLRNEGWLV